ncbi:hypothetical protein GUJ93_ZPchr0011g28274 [Zizania palustris]|uniref:Uncharacterized protein n=1 Tax=Zizania palustris TaxID=103762 RepID=A0A8J5WI87_ZIZPA|nr:hypothetical protein GUJ93_ZPchr0011g28274 [Zizania palustris]
MLGQRICGLAGTLPSKDGRPLALPSSGGSDLGGGEGGVGGNHIGGGRPTRRGQNRARSGPRSVCQQRRHGGEVGSPSSSNAEPSHQGREAGGQQGRRCAQGLPARGHDGREVGGSGSGGGAPRACQPAATTGGRSVATRAPDLVAPASDPDGATAGAVDLAMAAEACRPPMATTSSPQSGGAAGKGEEEAVGVMKVKIGADLERRGKEDSGTDDGGGSPAMEAAAAPAAGERRGEGGEPRALIPCRGGTGAEWTS